MKNFKRLLVLLSFFNAAKETVAQNRAQGIFTTLPLYSPQFIGYSVPQNGTSHKHNEVGNSPRDTVPYQYCQCSNDPKIVPQNRDSILRTYQAAVVASCTGLISGTTPVFKPQFASYTSPADSGCSINNITYFWSIPVGGDIAVINGSNTSQTVSVRIKGKGPFAVRLSSTTTCSDGSSCTNFDYYPDTSVVDSSHCKCEPPLDPPIERTSVQDSSRTYKVTVNPTCTGGYGFPPDLVECTTIKITYDWFISAGNNIAEIDGPSDQPSVKIKTKGPGIFTLEVMGDITCSDGQTCHYRNYRDDTIPPTEEKLCVIEPTEDVEPKMNGGLRPEFNKNITIKRDEFIALGAIGRDYDKVKFSCTPSDDCEDSYSEKEVALTGRVRFEWLINAGDGNFVKLGSLPSMIKKR